MDIYNVKNNILNTMNKLEEIFKSWGIAFDPNEAQADLAKNRIEICDVCDFKALTEIGPIISFARCTLCGCALKAKIYTPRTYLDGIKEFNDPNRGSCPESRWMEVEKTWLENKNEG